MAAPEERLFLASLHDDRLQGSRDEADAGVDEGADEGAGGLARGQRRCFSGVRRWPSRVGGLVFGSTSASKTNFEILQKFTGTPGTRPHTPCDLHDAPRVAGAANSR